MTVCSAFVHLLLASVTGIGQSPKKAYIKRDHLAQRTGSKVSVTDPHDRATIWYLSYLSQHLYKSSLDREVTSRLETAYSKFSTFEIKEQNGSVSSHLQALTLYWDKNRQFFPSSYLLVQATEYWMKRCSLCRTALLNYQLVAQFHKKREEELNVFGARTLEANAHPHEVCHTGNSWGGEKALLQREWEKLW